MQRKIKRNRVQINTGRESKVEQSHSKQCDINYILKDYARTGIIKHAHQNQGQYDDVSSVDFQTAMDVVADTKSMFESLPAATREQFGQDPKNFINFCRNPENGLKMQEMGITQGIDGIDSKGQVIPGMEELINVIGTFKEQPNTATAESGDSSAVDA
jgi:phage internal scaffolding protein